MSNVALKGFKRLRNLDSLVKASQASRSMFGKIEKLAIDSLVVGKYQPRNSIDNKTLGELSDSIKVQGIIQPLIVRKIEQDKYEIVAGERRWRAAKLASLEYVPAIIREIEDNVALAFALIENIQRKNLNSIEEAVAYARFRDEFSMTHDAIAHMVGRSRASITNALRLLLIDESVRRLLEEGKLDMGHVRALLTLNYEQQNKEALKIVEKNLSVREAEKMVNLIKHPKPVVKIEESFLDRCKSWSQELSDILSSSVSVELNSQGFGKVVIKIDSLDRIDWLIKHIKIE